MDTRTYSQGLRALLLALGLQAMAAIGARAQSCEFLLVDATPSGHPGNGNTLVGQAVSGDGRFVAFDSTSSNLVPGDFNGKRDVFVRDLWTGANDLVSIASDGTLADEASQVCDISVDGRFVVFKTWAKSLDPADQDGKGDIYVRDRLLGTTEWISKPLTPAPSVYDAHSVASISDDGRYVAFSSHDDTLVPVDTNGYSDVFVHDRSLGTSQIVSLSNSGAQGDLWSFDPLISADGTRVAFLSKATNLHAASDPNPAWPVHLYYRDLETGVTHAVDLAPNGKLPRKTIVGEYDMSPDGSTMVFMGDFLLTGEPLSGHLIWREGQPGYETISFPDGSPSWGMTQPKLSWDGRYVAFGSGVDAWSPNPASFTNIFLHDTLLGATSIVSTIGPGTINSGSTRAAISHDGRVVTFISNNPVFTSQPTNNHFHAVARLCDVSSGLTFCFPTRSPLGCLPTLIGSGTPSSTSGSGHDLVVSNARNDQIGLFFYGTAGDQVLPIASGWLCLAGPLTRMAAQPTGGTPPPAADCSGVLHADFNSWVAGGADPTLSAGTTVYVQSWSRDPSYSVGSLLSDAAAFVVGP